MEKAFPHEVNGENEEFFEHGAAVFEQKARPNHSAEQERIATCRRSNPAFRNFRLEHWDKQAIVNFHLKNAGGLPPADVHDARPDIVAVSPTRVWRVLRQAPLLSKWNGNTSKKGTGFEQPLAGISTG